VTKLGLGALVLGRRNAGHNHVGITDGLHLVSAVFQDFLVKACIDAVEQRDNLL